MTIGWNIWMICLILIWFFYGPSRMFQFPQFVWTLRFSVWDVFINFLLLDAADRSKISSDQKRFFIALSLYPLSFFANTPFNVSCKSSTAFSVLVDQSEVSKKLRVNWASLLAKRDNWNYTYSPFKHLRTSRRLAYIKILWDFIQDFFVFPFLCLH